MNEETAVLDANRNVLNTFDRTELIDGVLQKHKRFLAEYTTEFNELGDKMKKLQKDIESCKRERSDTIEKVEILAEKRQQFYHQAEKMLDEISIHDSGIGEFTRDISSIRERLSKAKSCHNTSVEEEQVSYLLESLSSLDKKLKVYDERFEAIKERIKVALSSKIELSSIDSSEDSYINKLSLFEEEINNIAPRYKWLENRIKSHQEAYDYWEGQKSIDDGEFKA